MVTMYPHTKNEVSISTSSKVRAQTDHTNTQTDILTQVHNDICSFM